MPSSSSLKKAAAAPASIATEQPGGRVASAPDVFEAGVALRAAIAAASKHSWNERIGASHAPDESE